MTIDSKIDLNSLIQNRTKTPTNDPNQQPTQPQLSPLEQALRNPTEKGVTVTKDEYEDGMHSKALTNPMGKERANDVSNWVNDMDDKINKVKELVCIKKPSTEAEYLEMVDELDAFDNSDPNNQHFNFLKDVPIINDDGSEGWKTVQDTERKPKYFRIPTKEEYDSIVESKNHINNDNDLVEESPNAEKPDKKKETIQVIIDKTGMGADVHFTEDERKKLIESDEIRVKEVRELSLNSLKIKKVTESFQEHVRKQTFSSSSFMVSFPASGFSAYMNGLTYGELGDATLSLDGAITTSSYNKRLSIIYNKMTNVSGGDFDNYEDFLKHFAFTDIYMALYGLLVSTFPELSSISLKCGNNECNKGFEWQYPTRSLLNLDECDQVFLDKMSDLIKASPKDYMEIRNNAVVNNCNVFEMPQSKIVFEMGILSAYEYLYNFIPVLNDENFKKEFGESINRELAGDFSLLAVIRKVYIPDIDGSYIVYDNYKDIMNIVFSIRPEESVILRSLMIKFISAYQPVFSISETICPHCGAKTDKIPVSMDEMLFQTLQRLASTTIDVSSMLNL